MVRAQLRMCKHLGESNMTFFELQQLAHNIQEQQELDEHYQEKPRWGENESINLVDTEEENSSDDDFEQILYTQQDNNEPCRSLCVLSRLQ